MKTLSILIAEDQALTRMDLKEMLEGAGYVVCADTNNGAKAVELAKQLMPDLAILDIKMPGLDGLEVARILHSMNIPVIILTAYSQMNFINRAEKVYVYNYLVKPIREKDLLPAIRIAYSRWKEMQDMQIELKNMEKKLRQEKLISRAKSIIAKEKNISEFDAHKYLIQRAMNHRITLIDCAQQIISKEKIK
ncbi:MAG: response regulator [Desulfitobacteriaceae bacterium]|nr:response regulator [Desulfitobacteriaceae bacterium]MDD4753890.1 response regulator [Desulfitobacteriaceae bacterium]